MANMADTNKSLAVLTFLLALVGSVQARTITVGPGTDHDCGTIQAGIDAAVPGDTVSVAPGEYVITVPVTFRGKAIAVRSQAGPEGTTIRMSKPANSQDGSVVSFESGETKASVLEGFTITGGTGSWREFPKGGGHYNGFGGGIVCSGSAPTIVACVITGNTSAWAGGGLISEAGSSPTVIGCAISGNSSREGGGIAVGLTAATFAFCTISGNAGQGMNVRTGSAKVTNSILWGNTGGQVVTALGGTATITYSDLESIWPGSGNLNVDPCFADPSNGDYHLKSRAGRWEPKSQMWVRDSVTSRCIDRGSPDSDWTAELWPHGKRVNMGADGGTPQASMSLSDAGNIADLNADNAAQFRDFAGFAERWLTVQVLLPEDLDRNGVVDFRDLAVFADNWLGEVREIGPVAHWKLDETEGIVAQDSTGNYDGILHGEPAWQSDSGKVRGALLLDGVDDYMSTAFVLDPAGGPFSVFAWVNGGFPGQVMISQKSGANWLMAAGANGALATELRQSGRQGKPLASSAVITDGAWHRVGFVWDGSNRILYVDGVEVAKGEQADLVASVGALYIGTGSTMSPASFWKGLIDDVRMYGRVMTP